MSMEMAVVTFEGTHHAEQELSSLRGSRDDAWLTEVAVLEHHRGGRFSMKATTPDYGEKDHVGAGASIGGLTGLALGAIAGPLGIVFWGTMGAMTGGALGDTGAMAGHSPPATVEAIARQSARGITAMATAAGAPQKFHMTITVAMLSAIAERMSDSCANFDAFASQHPELFDRELLLRHYSKERLSCPQARQTFLLPDRR